MDVNVGVFTRIKRALPIKDATLGADLQTKDHDQTTVQDQGSQVFQFYKGQKTMFC